MKKTTIVVVLVIGVMSSRYWAMEARVRETERVMVRMEAQVRERESGSESERIRFFFFLYTGRVWIISIPYPNYSGNIHTLPV